MKSNNQFALLRLRRFAPFFTTQFLGAFNDNVFKNALTFLLAFQGTRVTTMDTDLLINLSAGLFVLPFFLFSATAGQLADKYEKSRLMRYLKLSEVVIMLAAAFALYTNQVYLLIALLFLMGTQSSFFGPLKYGILPQHLSNEELVGGNALVEMGTFVAILIGSVTGMLIEEVPHGTEVIAWTLVLLALLGYLSSRGIPQAAAVDPTLRINWNPLSETWRIFQHTRANRTVFLSILGISWFWFYGMCYLVQLPNYTIYTLGGNPQVVALLMALFSIGIGVGSLLCERLSGRKVEIGLVPFGSIGLSLFALDLYFAAPTVQTLTEVDGTLIGAMEFMQHGTSWRILFDVLFIGMFGGFYIVPLYALVQQRSEPSHRSRIIAGNNILNAFFMVLSVTLAIIVLDAGFSIPQLMLLVAVLNAVVAIYIYTLVPEFLMRFIVWLLIHTIYRVDSQNLDTIPDSGGAVLACNHVSLVDALVIGGCVRRPVRFVMYYKIFKIPILSFVFRTAKAIPIASAKENPELLASAFDRIAEELEAGNVVCIFPEGRLTTDGEIGVFKTGIERIIERTPVPVIPMALCGLWGSFFSRKDGAGMGVIPKRLWSKVSLVLGSAVPPRDVHAADLQVQVQALRGDTQ